MNVIDEKDDPHFRPGMTARERRDEEHRKDMGTHGITSPDEAPPGSIRASAPNGLDAAFFDFGSERW